MNPPPPPPTAPLRIREGSSRGDRAALAEQVHQRLRSDILHARLRPGEAVSENSLAAALGVSRTPVREAVQRLVREGLVHVLPQRGSYVALLSMQRISEALFIREAVETRIVRHITEAPANAQGLRALDQAIAHQAAMLHAADLEGTMLADDAFHRILLDLCGLGGIWSVVGQARDMHRRVRAIAVPELQTGEQALTDHRAIVKALRQRHADRAEQAVAAHLQRNALLMRRIANLHPDYFEVDDRVNPVL